MRDVRFKSIIYQDSTRLYDIKNDPLETKDLADNPKYASVKRRHREHFREYLSRIEIYPGPPGLDEKIAALRAARRSTTKQFAQGNLYKAYVNWYEKVKAEG